LRPCRRGSLIDRRYRRYPHGIRRCRTDRDHILRSVRQWGVGLWLFVADGSRRAAVLCEPHSQSGTRLIAVFVDLSVRFINRKKHPVRMETPLSDCPEFATGVAVGSHLVTAIDFGWMKFPTDPFRRKSRFAKVFFEEKCDWRTRY